MVRWQRNNGYLDIENSVFSPAGIHNFLFSFINIIYCQVYTKLQQNDYQRYLISLIIKYKCANLQLFSTSMVFLADKG